MRRFDLAYVAACGVLIAAAVWAWHAPLSAMPVAHPLQGGYPCELHGEVALVRRAAADRWLVKLRQANHQVVQAHVALPLLPGDLATLRGTCTQAPGYFTPGSATPPQRAAHGGYDLGMRNGVVTAHVPGAQWHWRRGLARLSERVYAVITGHTSAADARGLLLGLVLGTTAELDETDQQIWRDLGTVHALSVSGLHLTVIALCAYFLLTRLALLLFASPRRGLLTAQLGTGLVVLLYAGVTGFQVATVRALVMAVAVLTAGAAGRSVDGWRTLILALGGMVAYEPRWISDPSFQLSASATAALVAAAPWFVDESPVPQPRATWRRAVHGVAKALAVSGWVSVCTAPLVAFHFHQVAPASPLANLLVTLPCELLALPMALLGVCLAPVSDALAGGCFYVAQGAAWASLASARWLATWLPAVECAPPTAWSIICYAGGCVAVWQALRARRRRWWLMAVIVVGMSSAPVFPPDAPAPAGALRITFIDMGQGDAALLEFPGGARWLVDAGAEPGQANAAYDPVLRYLRTRRITALDRVVVSHRHADHFMALCQLVGRVQIRSLWRVAAAPNPGEGAAANADAEAYARCEGALAARGTLVESPKLGVFREASLGEATVEVLGPRWNAAVPPLVHADAVRDENDNSLVLVVTFGGRRIAFLGDAEEELEGALRVALRPVDIVKVGHHGSRTSSTQALVSALRPGVAVVSVGRRNRFGLPNRDALVRWEHVGARILRTDAHGTISVTIARSGAWSWFTYRHGVVALP